MTKRQTQFSFGADVAFYDNFIVVSPEVATTWRAPPYLWLLSMCEAIRQQRPGTELLLMGYSKGAWWVVSSWPRNPRSVLRECRRALFLLYLQ